MEPAAATTTYTRIRDLPENDRPRERFRDRGPRSVSDAELLAILLRTGTGQQSAIAVGQALLHQFGGLEGIHRASITELCGVKGLGQAKAIEIKAALELAARLKLTAGTARPTVNSPDDAARLVVDEMSMYDQEHVRVLVLDARNRVIDQPDVYVGSVHTTQVRIAELFKPAIRANGSAVIVVHNHPSADPTPSAPDILLTQKLHDAAKLLDIDLHDHLIIGGGAHTSMRAANLGGFDDD